ncbi:hypothetical protein IscW_ISCW000486 [Ixodes scapularis]|uniref:Rho-GAP domain-containing protein n=1 Tax=Ixodes scapularis TaxID=6945 RepID=B7P6Z8_IXOSC|nr:hypothetical protein IscW_ISCW000486 [Ixodes scapularis]|eukprot:XP_002409423.1 hypothetical protein IscW_ISCW000486 [Ixodes scapularis]
MSKVRAGAAVSALAGTPPAQGCRVTGSGGRRRVAQGPSCPDMEAGSATPARLGKIRGCFRNDRRNPSAKRAALRGTGSAGTGGTIGVRPSGGREAGLGRGPRRSAIEKFVVGKPKLVTLSANPAGVAVLGHLSPADQRKVRNLALIELTAMYDALAVSFTRRKNTRRKTKESLLCGASLATLLEQDAHRHVRADHHQVPLVLREILDFLRRHGLREEGILRVSGSAVKMDPSFAPLPRPATGLDATHISSSSNVSDDGAACALRQWPKSPLDCVAVGVAGGCIARSLQRA